MTARTLNLDTLYLARGAHPDGDDMCVMEAVAYVAGEPWTDSPQCASPVIAAFLRTWQDQLPDGDRQELKGYIPRLVGSKGTYEQEDARGWMTLDWLARDYTPIWLRSAGLNSQADTLATLPEFIEGMDVAAARATVDAVRGDPAAARAVAWAAARAAARAVAWAAAWEDVEDVEDAEDTALAATAAAVGAAVGAADWAATAAATAAAVGAANEAAESQESVHRLIERMLAVV